MRGNGCDKKVGVESRTCWLLTVLTVSLVVNVVFAAVCYVTMRNQQSDILDLQKKMAELQEQQSATSEMKHEISDILSVNAADREKRSVLSSNSSSRVAVDVGSVFVSAIKSMCKPEGVVCIPGAKGEGGQAGRDGLPGVNGLAGRDGKPGRDGRPGIDGNPGSDGTPGKDGEPGDDGLPGRDGLSGATGRDGPIGLSGPPGKPGAKGMGLPGKQGPIGIPGVKGEKGERGEKGGKGDIGGQGIQGVKGIRGEKGERGDRGERGYTGFKGEMGETGEKGLPGEKGNRGIQGEKGETSKVTLPSQCNNSNHQVLSNKWRKVSYTKAGFRCDAKTTGFQPGWYVFDASIGGKMPQTCPPTGRCGAFAPGWLKGSHPTEFGQTSKETVCFHWNEKCCNLQVTVDITNCGGFYAYKLPYTSNVCSSVYCGDA